MEEATGAPSSFAVWHPRRLRASGRDGETVMTESPSSLTMLLSRHIRRREIIAVLGEGDVQHLRGSKSAASRRFVALLAARMKEWMACDLSGLDLLVIPSRDCKPTAASHAPQSALATPSRAHFK